MPVSTDYAPSGGISRSLIGKNICRPRRRSVPHKLSEPTGRANYDRHVASRLAATGIYPRIDQSIADLWIAHGLDWTGHRSFFEEPPRSSRNVSARAHHLCFGLAGLRIWRTSLRPGPFDGGRRRESVARCAQRSRRRPDLDFLRAPGFKGHPNRSTDDMAQIVCAAGYRSDFARRSDLG